METKTKKGATIQAAIADGRLTITVAGHEPLVVTGEALSEANRAYAILHGMKQRIVDAAAIARDTTTGLAATPAEKYEAMRELVAHYMSGAEAWSPTRTGGGAKGGDGGVTLRAMAKVRGVPVDVLKGQVEAAAAKRGMTTKAYYAIVATYPDIAAEIAAMKAAGQGAGATAADLLDELGGVGE